MKFIQSIMALCVLIVCSCKKEIQEQPAVNPSQPQASDPREVYSGNYNFTIYRTHWNIMMPPGAVTDTINFLGTVYPDQNSLDKVGIAYGAGQLDSLLVIPDATGNFWIHTCDYYPGSFDTLGNVNFSYRASYSPSHFDDRVVSGVRY